MRRFTSDERVSYQSLVRNNVFDIMEGFASIIVRDCFELEEATKIHATLLSRELAEWETCPKSITAGVVDAVQGLWADEQLQSAFFASKNMSTSTSAP
jgi:hypothetical protein